MKVLTLYTFQQDADNPFGSLPFFFIFEPEEYVEVESVEAEGR